MSVEAELYDGTILEFPDGTDPKVIQAKVKELTKQKRATEFYQNSQGGLFGGVRDYIGTELMNTGAFIGSGLKGAYDGMVTGDAQTAGQGVTSFQNEYMSEPKTEFGQSINDAVTWLAGQGVDMGNSVLGGASAMWASQAGHDPEAIYNQIKDDGFVRFTEDTLLNAGVPPSVVALAKGSMVAGLTRQGFKSQIGDVPTKKDLITQKLKEGSTSKDTALYKLEAPSEFETPFSREPGTVKSNRPFELEDMRAVKDKSQKALVSQGFDKEMLPPMRESSKADIVNYRKMTDTARSMKDDAVVAITRSPLDIVGDSLLSRYHFIRKKLIHAGQDVSRQANGLKGKSVDFSPAVQSFEAALESMGVKILRDGDYRLDFSDSILKGKLLAKNRKAINDVVEQMKSVKGSPDAWQVHNLKKALDEVLEWGSSKGKEGFAGKTERLVKQLRRDMDGVLDGAFDAYDKANTNFAELKLAMEQFEDILGKKIDYDSGIAHKQAGLQLRKLGSNYASKHPIFNAVNIINDTASKFGGKFKDDLIKQVMFANKLNKRFMLDGDNTFKALSTQAEFDALSKAGVARKVHEAVRDRYRNDDLAFKALYKWLDELESIK